jgi:Zc3h12a-like Ribonuclease NYN domain/S1 RNA binding domain
MPNDPAPNRQIVVDGSNLATEGRSLPSLAQLEEAIQAFLEEFPGFRNADVIVVVDASFGHRIDESERATFEEAIAHGEMVTPPAGAIGRGDAFILRIAEKAGALVLSNDSFQEFHVERPWLFEPGRLIGGKPIPGVGWIFTPRTPVRGAVSRATTSRAKKAAVAEDEATSTQAGRTGGRTSKAGEATKKSGGRRRKPSEPAPDAEGDELGASGTDAASGSGDEVPKKARSTVKKTAGRAKKAAAVDEAGAADKASAPTKAAAKTAKGTKAASKGAKATKAAKATKTASKATKTASKTAKGTASKGRGAAMVAADEVPTVDEPAGSGKRPGRRAKKSAARAEMAQAGAGDEAPLLALNEPMTFLTFVANHPIGSTFTGTVASYTSHGAHIDVDGMKAHVPLSLLGRPAPAKARDVLSKGETRDFVLVSLDAPRRRAEVALPEFAPDI